MYNGPIIDAFLHGPWIGKPDPERADVVPWTDDPRLRRVMRTFHHEGGTPGIGLDDLLATMTAAGVGEGLLIGKVYYPTTRPRLGVLHAALSGLSAGSGGRLKWVATVRPPEHGPGSYWNLMENPRLIERLRDDAGLCGVHITPSPWGLPPNDRWYYPIYARCADLGLALFSYVGAPGPLWPMGPNDPAHLDDVALAFPDLTIVAHHIGDPWTETAIRLAARHEHVYICTSAWAPKAYPAVLVDFLRGGWHGTRGADKVIFASDHPLLDLGRAVKAARTMDLQPDALERFLHGNAKRLFFR